MAQKILYFSLTKTVSPENLLGLKLGLDLEGGAHLVYQADYGTTTYIKTTAGVKPEVVAQLIEQSKTEILEVISNEENTEFYVKTTNLSDDMKTAIMNIKDQGLLINTEIELEMKDGRRYTFKEISNSIDLFFAIQSMILSTSCITSFPLTN